MKLNDTVKLIEGKYDPDIFFKAVKGLENEPEGGKRCEICIKMRIKAAAGNRKGIQSGFFLQLR